MTNPKKPEQMPINADNRSLPALTQLFGRHEIRAVERDGEFWFMAADIAKALEIGNPTQAMTRLDEDEVTLISNEGSEVEANFVSESGLYSLILGSRKPQAKPFKRWVTHTLLPTLRRQGFIDLRQPVITRAGLKHATRLQANDVAFQLRLAGVAPIGFAEDPSTGFAEPVYDILEACRVFRWDYFVQPLPYRGAWQAGPLQPELAARATDYKMARRTLRVAHKLGMEHDWQALPDYVSEYLKGGDL